MKHLQYKTRGNALPKGKPYIYLFAHEKDFPLYFERIFKKLLKTVNCAVFYDDGSGESCDEETRFSDLLQMKLFVLPITTRFLSDENSIAMREFRFAVQNHIPILPILQEKGIESLFNSICGEMQMLSVIPGDGTEISFDEKLEKFLSSVLIGDELAEKIRNAFDAYIFLSYRKKDRKYAQELIRLIHKNEFCRDIAIWYDEFLTPGENFNNEIASALNKSKIFALAVTPNLINEKNYIMDIEYPMAKNAEKPILPAEIVPTDKEALKQYYQSIPDTVNPYDAPALSDALMQTLEMIAIRENDNSPEHNFFIGLAYLSGIDVEVDRERALKLITSAAEAELPEAIEKLASLYATGESVEYDRKEELRWRKKLIQTLKKAYANSPEESAGIRLLNAMWALENTELKYQNKEEYIQNFEEALAFSKTLSESFPSQKTERMVEFAYQELAQALASAERHEEAEICFQKALALAERLLELYGTVLYKRDLACIYTYIGSFYDLRKRDFVKSAEFYEKSRELSERILTEAMTEQALLDLAYDYEKLAKIYTQLSAFEKAEQNYQNLIAIRERIVKETGREEAPFKLATAHLNFARFHEDWQRNEEAEREYLLCLQCHKEIAQKTGTGEDYAFLNGVISQFIDFYIKTGNAVSAIPYGEEMICVAKRYTYSEKNYFNQLIGLALSEAYKQNAKIYEAIGDLKQELFFLQKAIENGENAAKTDISQMFMISWDYMNLGSRYLSNGFFEEAEECYRKNFHFSVLSARKADLFGSIQTLPYACENVARILEKRGKTEEAARYQEWKTFFAEAFNNEVNCGNFAQAILHYAQSREKEERDEWRLRVLEFYDLICGTFPNVTQYQTDRDRLRAELAEETNGQI